MAKQLSYDFAQLSSDWTALSFRQITKDDYVYTVDGSFTPAKGVTREQAAQYYAEAVAQIEACAKPDAWESKMAEALTEKFIDGTQVGAERVSQDGVMVTEVGLRCESGAFLEFAWLRKLLAAEDQAKARVASIEAAKRK